VSKLRGGIALAIGSASGNGAAIATAFTRYGATVVANSSSSRAAGERLAAELPGASYVQADVGEPHDAARLVATTVERHGPLDIVVDNAGTTQVIRHPDLDAATNDIWERIRPRGFRSPQHCDESGERSRGALAGREVVRGPGR
jgi:ketoreductase RED2